MQELLPQCQDLKAQVNSLLHLLNQEASLRVQQNTSAIESSLEKATAPSFKLFLPGHLVRVKR